MDRPDLDGVFDLRGYTSQILPHSTDEEVIEVVFFKDGPIVANMRIRLTGDEVIFDNLEIIEAEQNKGLLTEIIAKGPSAFRKAGYKTWVINIKDPDLELSQMYQKLGFKHVGDRLEGKIGSAGKLEKTAQARLKRGGAKP